MLPDPCDDATVAWGWLLALPLLPYCIPLPVFCGFCLKTDPSTQALGALSDHYRRNKKMSANIAEANGGHDYF